ncbi:hypothetical protein NQ317_015946 [Molorchus minor]|uniref:Uncharacterized protein n=1 Tax=Molorchus minor TaxID=1323400 RepID=A0ABQ9IRB3_9CUCU|nr:hypothetical protein NQ317_015946 [Molorchus minor]
MTDYNVFGLMVCRSCLRSLTMYLKFATVCATTEKYITKYCGQINTNSQTLVELNHVRMFKENENEGEILRKVPLSEIIGKHYQPMENNEDYNIAELICRSCVGPLTSYLKFATVCVTTEEKIIKYCEQIDANGQGLVELNCVRMFCNEKHPKRKTYLNTEVIGVKNVVQQRTGCLRNDANYLIHIKNTPCVGS